MKPNFDNYYDAPEYTPDEYLLDCVSYLDDAIGHIDDAIKCADSAGADDYYVEIEDIRVSIAKLMDTIEAEIGARNMLKQYRETGFDTLEEME